MKTNDESARREHAQNEKRDSNGRFESEKTRNGSSHSGKSGDMHQNHQGKDAHHSSMSRSKNAEHEKRDSHGRFEA